MDIDLQNLKPIGKINYQGIQEALPVYDGFLEMLDDPMKHNQALLMKLLEDNKDTEYGRKYDFAHIHSIEEYQKKVPVTRYDDYVGYILRETEDGESHLLSAYDVSHYCKSSGTMGNPKRLPMSDRAMEIFFKYNGKCRNALLYRELGNSWINGRALSLTESASHIDTLKNGATYGALSVKIGLSTRQYSPYLYISPDQALYPEPGTNTRYLHARFGLMDNELTWIGSAFATVILELLRYIEGKWELLVKDIAEGTIDDSIKMPDHVRESLLTQIKPMPERAAELRAIFEQGFDEPFGPKVWPSLRFMASVCTAGFKGYAETIRKKYLGEDVAQFRLGINASEGIFSVPFKLDCDDGVLLPDSMFYEFLPLDAGDDFSKIVTMDQLEVGKEYEVITTNLSGFYRYRMRDAIKVTGMYRNTPTIQFLYRIDQTVSLTGEKTTEVALQYAAEQTAKDLDFELIDFSMFPDRDAVPARYLYFMEIGKMPEGLKAKEIRYVLEHNLAKANPSMGTKVQRGICGPTKLNILEPETYMLYRDLMIMKGVSSAQLKPVHIITNEIQRKFFFGLTEYGVELVK